MAGVTHLNTLPNEVDLPFRETDGGELSSKTGELIKKMADTNDLTEKLSENIEKKTKNNHDKDIKYAMRLLKKKDQNVTVYSHLKSILNQILTEKPSNPLEDFEKYSKILKRTYIHEEVNFEHIYVDNISRVDCQNNLQMYQCASKIEYENQKRYYDSEKVVKKSTNSKSQKNKTSDNNNDDIQVQNLWEANYMFNKAGCGLTVDEVALISITMNSMSKLNKFRTIRYWGKIFGMKKVYFVIECEWINTELQRKLFSTKRENIATSKSDNTMEKPPNLFKSKTLTKKKALPEAFRDSFKQSVSDIDERRTDDSIGSHDSLTWSNENQCLKTQFENTEPAEMFGIGANRCVYFVTNKLNGKWIELESVQPHHIVEARKIKRYFTGNLYEPIDSYPKFNGLEMHYLRAQIARISASTHVCPLGYYTVDRREITQLEPSNVQPRVSSELNKIIRFDFNLNKNFHPISNTNLINTSNWIYKNPRIQDNGIADNSNFPTTYDPAKNVYSFKNKLKGNEDDLSYYENAESENMENDIIYNSLAKKGISLSGDNSPVWKGVLCSPFNSQYSHTVMKSSAWPGAYSVAHQFKSDFVYIGWGQKQDLTSYASNLINEVQMEHSTGENLVEYEEVNNDLNKNIHKQKKKEILIKKNINAFDKEEKILNNYTYSF